MPVPKGVDPDKYDRCVEDVKDKGGAKNAYAVCAASLKRSEVQWDGIEKNISQFNSMFKAIHWKAPRASVQAYPEHQTGVHTSTSSKEPGRSTAGLMTRIGAKPQARQEHKQVIAQQRAIKPKLP